jgi:hypothetical protein
MVTWTGDNFEEWKAYRIRLDDLLYDRYGRPLEETHTGEFVAISDEGQTILGDSAISVASQALEIFGPGRYAFRKIGAEYDVQVLDVRT